MSDHLKPKEIWEIARDAWIKSLENSIQQLELVLKGIKDLNDPDSMKTYQEKLTQFCYYCRMQENVKTFYKAYYEDTPNGELPKTIDICVPKVDFEESEMTTDMSEMRTLNVAFGFGRDFKPKGDVATFIKAQFPDCVLPS